MSVASGTPWLGKFGIDAPGPVLMFVGEGGERKVVRRLRAVSASRDLGPEALRSACACVPHLTSEAAMMLVEAEVADHPPTLVTLDPLYLAARGRHR